MAVKPLLWLGSSRDDVRSFPNEARKVAGYELFQVQQGLAPSDWKPFRTVGTGVREIRLKIGRAFRILYVAKFAEGIYVIHAFEKRTHRTAQADVDLARQRFRELLRWREQHL